MSYLKHCIIAIIISLECWICVTVHATQASSNDQLKHGVCTNTTHIRSFDTCPNHKVSYYTDITIAETCEHKTAGVGLLEVEDVFQRCTHTSLWLERTQWRAPQICLTREIPQPQLLPALTVDVERNTAIFNGKVYKKVKFASLSGLIVIQRIPARPPDVDEFSFSVIRSDDKTDHPVICVTWKPLSRELDESDYVMYIIEVSSGNWHYKTRVTGSYVLIEDVTNSNVVNVKIWAANEYGTSTNYSEICIKKKEPHKSKSYAEFTNEGDVKIYVNSNSVFGAEKLAFQVCGGGMDSTRDLCFEVLATQVLDMTDAVLKDGHILEFFVSYLSRSKMSNTNYSNKIEYTHLQNLNDSVNISNIDIPFLTLYRPDNGNYETLLNKSPETSLAIMDGGEYRTIVAYEEVKNKKVFMSVMEGGAWTGMVPVSCYFSDLLPFNLPQVKLNITKSDDSAEFNKVHLSFRQECPHNPNQFMAKYFIVFSTSSPNCDNGRHIIANLSNKIFDDVQAEIQRDSKFVCIEVVGKNNVSDVFGPIIFIHGDGDKKLAIILESVNAFFLISVIIVSGYFALKRCCRRKCSNRSTVGCLNRGEHQLNVINHSMTTLDNVSTTSMDTMFNVNADFQMFLNPVSRSLLSGSIEDNIHVINESVSGSDSEISTDI